MNEGRPSFEQKNIGSATTPEGNEQHKKPTKEELEILACFLKDHPEETAQVETRRDCELEVQEYNILLTKFEEAHSLAELNAIPDVTPELYDLFAHDKVWTAEQIETAFANLSPEDAKRYKTRSPAIKDLIPIVALMNKIEKETNITQTEFAKLKAAYKILSRAVGMINNNKIDHTR
jgi:hypothetical protein